MFSTIWNKLKKYFYPDLVNPKPGPLYPPPFDLAADMKNNPLKYGVPIPGAFPTGAFTTGVNSSAAMGITTKPVTYGPENIPGPHPKPKRTKAKVRSITDEWEISQDSA